MVRKIVIIGAGASGMMAAAAAARHGAEVTLLEKNRSVGKKLLITGNGRCNLSNRCQELKNYRSDNPEFVKQALQAFPMTQTVEFFEDLGIRMKEQCGRLYPNSGQASSIADALRMELERLKVKLRCNTEAKSVEPSGGGFLVRTEGWTYGADAVILACGSMAAPDTGSTGDGCRFAEGLGHQAVRQLPALTGLYASERDCKRLAGVRMEGKVRLLVEKQQMEEEEGETQFTSYGLSGIPVFQLSRYVSRALDQGRDCEICLDLWPEDTREQIAKRLCSRGVYTKNRSGADILLGVFPKKLSGVLLDRTGISADKKEKDFTNADFLKLAAQIKNMRFTITKCRGYEQAQVCTGGVPLSQLKGITMESAKTPGLYLSGELLDVDGACGGYNLQWAWTSGYLAGSHAAKGKRGLCSESNS